MNTPDQNHGHRIEVLRHVQRHHAAERSAADNDLLLSSDFLSQSLSIRFERVRPQRREPILNNQVWEGRFLRIEDAGIGGESGQQDQLRGTGL